MKYPFLALGMIMVGMSGLVFITMFQSITVNNESEYYVLKEAMEAAMLESVDIVCYRSSENPGCGGTIKISEQKFVENFTRRFANSINGDASSYKLEFYDIIESPPKASVVIQGKNGEYKFHTGQSISNDIENALTGILETSINYKKYDTNLDDSDFVLDVDVPNQDISLVTPNHGCDEIITDANSGEETSGNCSNDGEVNNDTSPPDVLDDNESLVDGSESDFADE